MRIHFVVHESFEAPGAFEEWAKVRGYEVGYSQLYAGETVPDTIDGIDMLIVMGGPQTPDTTTAKCPHFDAHAERRLITTCVDAGRAVIGVCLGAQLIGEALGARFERSPETEIGSFPITLTADGLASDRFAGLERTFEVGHWHNDMPGLTEASKVLATSAGCPRQIVEYGPFVYGFQCHMEFNRAVVEGLIEHSADELVALSRRRFVQQPEELRRNGYDAMNDTLFSFLDQLTADYCATSADLRT
jgi:GMP synthase (glutamine-hydrolysing)